MFNATQNFNVSLSSFLVCGFLFLFSISAYSQDWQRIGADLRGVEWINDSSIITVGEYGTIMTSLDKGATWQYTQSGITQTIYAAHFFDTQTSVVGGQNFLKRTTDGGRSWTETLPASATVRSFSFLPSPQGQGAATAAKEGECIVLLTADSGKTWQTLNTGHKIFPSKISWIDETSLIIIGSSSSNTTTSTVLLSTDTGRTWTSVLNDSIYLFSDIAISGSTGIITGYKFRDKSIIYQSTDKGRTWDTADISGVDALLHTVESISDSQFFAAGQRPSTSDINQRWFAYSNDYGHHWEMLESPEIIPGTQAFLDLSFSPDQSNAIAVGELGSIAISSNPLETWELRAQSRLYPFKGEGQYNFFSNILFYSENEGIAIGADVFSGNNIVIRTTDNGITWRTDRTLRPGIRGIAKIGKKIIATTDRSRPITNRFYLVSKDATSWEIQGGVFDEAYIYNLQSPIVNNDEESGLYFGDSILFHSSDQGETWHKRSVVDGAIAINSINFISPSIGTVTAQGPFQESDSGLVNTHMVFVTTDSGYTWNNVYSISTLQSIQVHGYFRNNHQGTIAIGLNSQPQGFLFNTQDGGLTWDTTSISGTPYDMQFFNESVGFVVGMDALILSTYDGGRSWEQQIPWDSATSGELDIFRKVSLLPDKQTLMILGREILIRGTLDSAITSSIKEKPAEVKSERLQLTISPNPAEEDIRGELITAESQHIKIELYDIRGVRLKVILDTTIQRGHHIFNFPVSDLNEGTYIVKATTLESTTTSSLLIIH